MAHGTTLRVRGDIRLNELIRLARLAAGFPRKEIAQRLGLSPRTYERIEDGSRQPRAGELLAIEQITGQGVGFFENASFNGAAEDGTLSPSPEEIKGAFDPDGDALARRLEGEPA